MVPRAASRPAARMAGRRPRAPQGGGGPLRRRGGVARPVAPPVPEPFGPLHADWHIGAVKIRRATEADEALIRELWEAFEEEVPEPEGFLPETWEQEWGDV